MVVLRDYQEDLVSKTINSLWKNDRVLTVAPCGSGKSYMFAKLVELTGHGEVLILTHRQELKAQHESLLTGLGLENWRVAMIMTEANRLGKYQKPRLIVTDEAHLSRANSWEKVLQYYNTKTVGFTATPARLDGKPLGDIYQDLITGIEVRELIDMKRLAPFDYYAPFSVKTDSLTVSRGDYVVSDLEKLMNEKAIYSDAIASWKKLANNQKTIAYCVSVKHADQVAEAFRNHGITAVSISANTKDRLQIMDDFRNGKIKVLCNVGIISEGISIDDVTCCLMLRPTESLALNIQQSQRCMRYMPDKRATIIDCVGNYLRHGLPDEVHEWSLTESVKKRKQLDEHGNLTVRMCPECFMTFKTAPICPYCGADYPLHPRELKAHEEIELQRITAEQIAEAERVKKQQRMAVGRCRTLGDLWAIARERNYSPGWVWKMAKVKGIKH